MAEAIKTSPTVLLKKPFNGLKDKELQEVSLRIFLTKLAKVRGARYVPSLERNRSLS